ncbi:Glyoxalase/fosfomycin resistance/dioxygenase [Purpureocillium lavendulum]|uniref:Glyoxalase/fosfomycin resistance/dioxygenase n=1 Tax=Purpureocillium lavendulum TaxID=1247861 RepID=A0AB34FH04_9HYPO|nr:Glyoxalase/fosfomycin resistance/dioxygenase [Purpureocillium lavendulum]
MADAEDDTLGMSSSARRASTERCAPYDKQPTIWDVSEAHSVPDAAFMEKFKESLIQSEDARGCEMLIADSTLSVWHEGRDRISSTSSATWPAAVVIDLPDKELSSIQNMARWRLVFDETFGRHLYVSGFQLERQLRDNALSPPYLDFALACVASPLTSQVHVGLGGGALPADSYFDIGVKLYIFTLEVDNREARTIESVIATRIILNRLSYVIYEHPDIEKFRSFAKDFGLIEVGEADGLYFYRGYGQDAYIYVAAAAAPGSVKRFVGAGFVAQSADDFNLACQISGAEMLGAAGRPGGGQLVQLRDPNGYVVQIAWGQEQRTVPAHGTSSCVGQPPMNGALDKNRKGLIHKLGHFGYVTDNYDETRRWYGENFNFIPTDLLHNPSDKGHEVAAFMRIDRGKIFVDHHSFLIVRGDGEGTTVHHSSFEVEDIDTQMMGHQWLAQAGWVLVWGVGRHIHGSQIFDYWYDSSGFIVEHYADGDVVNEETGAVRRYAAHPQMSDRGVQLLGLLECMYVLDLYRVLLMRRPPTLAASDLIALCGGNGKDGPENAEIASLLNLVEALVRPGQSVDSKAIRRHNIPSLGALSTYIWPVTCKAFAQSSYGTGEQADNPLWKGDFSALACDKWLHSQQPHHDHSAAVLYHCMKLVMHADIEFLQGYFMQSLGRARQSRNRSSQHTIVRTWLESHNGAVATWHANALLSEADGVLCEETRTYDMASSDTPNSRIMQKAYSDPPHIPYAVYFATLVLWAQGVACEGSGFALAGAAEVALGQRLLRRCSSRIARQMDRVLAWWD